MPTQPSEPLTAGQLRWLAIESASQPLVSDLNQMPGAFAKRMAQELSLGNDLYDKAREIVLKMVSTHRARADGRRPDEIVPEIERELAGIQAVVRAPWPYWDEMKATADLSRERDNPTPNSARPSKLGSSLRMR